MEGNYPIRASKTSLDIVEALVDLNGAGVSEVAVAVNKPNSTVHNHLKTLKQCGYVVKTNSDYRVSTKFLDIGAFTRYQMNLYRIAKQEIDDLAAKTGEHVSLMIEENGLGVLLYTALGTDAIQVETHPGMRMTLHTTAPGKAILANLSNERVDDIIDQYGLQEKTEYTITDRESLFQELERVRETGYAVDKNERIGGVTSLGVPLVTTTGALEGAISIYGPGHRFTDEKIESLSQLLYESKNIIEINLEYP